MCYSWIYLSNEPPNTLNGYCMENLRPREVVCSTNHLGAIKFMMIHLLGLVFWMFSVFSLILVINRPFWPPFVFILSWMTIATTSILKDITTAILVAFVLKFVPFHLFNRVWVYCTTIVIAIYLCMWMYMLFHFILT